MFISTQVLLMEAEFVVWGKGSLPEIEYHHRHRMGHGGSSEVVQEEMEGCHQ